MRLTKGTVGFRNPFQMEGFPGLLPPGTYATATYEQEGDGALYEMAPKSTTLFCTPSVDHLPGREKWTKVSALELNAALDRDSDGMRGAPGIGLRSALVAPPMESYTTLPATLNARTGMRMPMSRRRWASRSTPR